MAHPILEARPDFATRWKSFGKQLIKWCKTRGSIHGDPDGFTVGQLNQESRWVRLMGYDNYEKSIHFAASWPALNELDRETAREQLLPFAKEFGVRAQVAGQDGALTLEWWGALEQGSVFAAFMLDNLGFDPRFVADSHLREPRLRIESEPGMRAALDGLGAAHWRFRQAVLDSQKSGYPSSGRAGLIAERDSYAEIEAEEELNELRLNRPAPAPEPQPYGVSHEGAEHLVAAWMRHLGVLDAEVTRFSGDGGIDVDSEQFIAQVKNYAGTVPVDELRALHGVAVMEGKAAILFTSGSLTAAAAEFADRAGIIVLRYNAVEATLEGLNDVGVAAEALGLTT
ncbi:MAG: restriction endonuclease [Kineosporiaceae bacterium]|nr:restriction endonuclease [Aeromicrobium sp.]